MKASKASRRVQELAAIAGKFNTELARQIDFLKAENKILEAQLPVVVHRS